MGYDKLTSVNRVTKTGYEWSLDFKIRILDLNEWPLEWYGSKERYYFQFPFMGEDDFLEAIKSCKVKYNSTPRKTALFLNYRMYGLVPFNILGIQKGIQFGHAVVEYGLKVYNDEHALSIYRKWARFDKTFIILNGGTTNENEEGEFYGSLQKHRDAIRDMGIRYAEFKEPDLNDTLSAVVFLVDERVYDRELYPDFVEEKLPYSRKKPSEKVLNELAHKNEVNYEKWVEKIGGPQNAFLREHLRNLKLA